MRQDNAGTIMGPRIGSVLRQTLDSGGLVGEMQRVCKRYFELLGISEPGHIHGLAPVAAQSLVLAILEEMDRKFLAVVGRRKPG